MGESRHGNKVVANSDFSKKPGVRVMKQYIVRIKATRQWKKPNNVTGGRNLTRKRKKNT